MEAPLKKSFATEFSFKKELRKKVIFLGKEAGGIEGCPSQKKRLFIQAGFFGYFQGDHTIYCSKTPKFHFPRLLEMPKIWLYHWLNPNYWQIFVQNAE